MKTIKILLLLVVLSAVTFYSCSDENSIRPETSAEKSTAIRTVLNKLKMEQATANRGAEFSATTANPSLCFEFVFPITFSYNNGTAITATSLAGLLSILNNESPALHLSSVVFPFQVQYGGAVHSINNEAELVALIIQCGLPTFYDDLEHTYCFDIEFPITAGSEGQVITINSQEQLSAYLNNKGSEANIIFPISITDDNGTVMVLNSVYDFYTAVNNCNANDCICNLEYAPVCVQTPAGIMEFGNMCFAICAGYDQSDLVSCNGNNECSITNVVALPGACNNNGTYELMIAFDSVNTNATEFQVVSGNTVLGTYPIASLPVTIAEFPYSLAAIPSDSCEIRIVGTNCTATASWLKPNCNAPCICPAVVNPVCVQTGTGVVKFQNDCLAACAGFTPNDFVTCTYDFGSLLGNCFTMNYPVTVQGFGMVVIVNSDDELRQYWNPASGPMPNMTYPITVSFGGAVYTVANQAEFEEQIRISCP